MVSSHSSLKLKRAKNSKLINYYILAGLFNNLLSLAAWFAYLVLPFDHMKRSINEIIVVVGLYYDEQIKQNISFLKCSFGTVVWQYS